MALTPRKRTAGWRVGIYKANLSGYSSVSQLGVQGWWGQVWWRQFGGTPAAPMAALHHAPSLGYLERPQLYSVKHRYLQS